MTARGSAWLAAIWRHPVKSLGRERLGTVELSEGRPLPWDRRWAIAHEAARLDPAGGWSPCQNFVIGSKSPALMAVNARLDEATGSITLTHPARPTETFRPDDPDDAARMVAWMAPLADPGRAAPARVIAMPGRGHTDTDYPSVSLLNLASNAALSSTMGAALSPERWRCNLWFEGLEPWEEEAWPGRRIAIGEAVLEAVEPIVRCTATTANPATGLRDADTLSALRSLRGEANCGVYARVLRGGTVREGDGMRLL
jgi:hypothetical protein